jgi:hypothetical protein
LLRQTQQLYVRLSVTSCFGTCQRTCCILDALQVVSVSTCYTCHAPHTCAQEPPKHPPAAATPQGSQSALTYTSPTVLPTPPAQLSLLPAAAWLPAAEAESGPRPAADAPAGGAVGQQAQDGASLRCCLCWRHHELLLLRLLRPLWRRFADACGDMAEGAECEAWRLCHGGSGRW